MIMCIPWRNIYFETPDGCLAGRSLLVTELYLAARAQNLLTEHLWNFRKRHADKQIVA